MTSIVFYRKDGLLYGFVMSGHSGYAKHGEDIVCSALSSAAYMTANTITDVLMLKADITVDDAKLSLELNGSNIIKAQDILQGFYLHINQLREQYPQFIKAQVTEV